MAWSPTDVKEEADFGTRYRTNIACHAWAFPLVDPGKMVARLKAGTKLAGGRIHIDAVEFFAPGGVPNDWVQRGVKKTDWGFRVTWRKVAAGTPVAVLAAAIIAVVVTVGFVWVVVAKFTEKELLATSESLGDRINDTKDLLLSTLFQPGLVIAALVVVVLALRKKG